MNNPILTLFLTKVAVAGWRTGGRERCRGEPLYYRALSLVSRRAPCRHSVDGALLSVAHYFGSPLRPTERRTTSSHHAPPTSASTSKCFCFSNH